MKQAKATQGAVPSPMTRKLCAYRGGLSRLPGRFRPALSYVQDHPHGQPARSLLLPNCPRAGRDVSGSGKAAMKCEVQCK